MTSRHGLFRHVRSMLLFASLAGPLAAAPLGAQLIPVKTVPIADGDQFSFFPSSNFGMAGISLALHDSLLDPFLNPATAARIRRSAFFGSPTFYDVTYGAGGGRTLPLGALAKRGQYFGGVMLALQQVDPSKRAHQQFFAPGTTVLDDGLAVNPPAPPEKNENNYAFGLAGR